ncbi:hypothetical protein KKG41_06180 [Patescibacteria group bacterium]|nr:hypothetical protein [Patescibacteria group bacterium]MBU1891089.1 hypothetical protein [Patescibacteria group bacterium]
MMFILIFLAGIVLLQLIVAVALCFLMQHFRLLDKSDADYLAMLGNGEPNNGEAG